MDNACKYCEKRYIRSSYLKQHEAMCMMRERVVQKSNHVISADIQEDEDVIPLSVMHRVVNELVMKMAKMEEEIAMLKKWAKKEKVRVNLIEWLTEHEIPSDTFIDWYKKTIVITRHHLELVFKYDFVHAVPYIFEDVIKLEEIKTLPFKCFDQKVNVFYVFNSEKKWIQLTSQEFSKFIDHIHTKIIVENIKWQKENKNMLEDDSLCKEYLENNLKVLASKYEPEYIVNQIRNKIYNYLKYNLNSVHEYEFIF